MNKKSRFTYFVNVCCEAVCAIFCRYICLSDLNLLKCPYLSIFSSADSANIKCWPGIMWQCVANGKWDPVSQSNEAMCFVFTSHLPRASLRLTENISALYSIFNNKEQQKRNWIVDVAIFSIWRWSFLFIKLIDSCNLWTHPIFMMIGFIPITPRLINLLTIWLCLSSLTTRKLLHHLIGWKLLLLASYWRNSHIHHHASIKLVCFKSEPILRWWRRHPLLWEYF